MGIGKSGHVGNKIAATLASTGTSAFFVHPTEAGAGLFLLVLRNNTQMPCIFLFIYPFFYLAFLFGFLSDFCCIQFK